jgi:hypothetical protein
MTNKLSQTDNIVLRMKQMVHDAQELGIIIPIELQKADPQVIIDYLGEVQSTADSTQRAFHNIEDAAGKEKLIRQTLQDQTDQVQQTMIAKRKVFNLKKAQSDFPESPFPTLGKEDMGMGMSEFGDQNMQFSDFAQLKDWLDGLARTDAEYALMPLIPDQQQDAFKSLMQDYFEEGAIILTDSQKLKIAEQVWEMLPDHVKSEDVGEIEAPFRRASTGIVNFVNKINDEIKQMASVKPKTKFNLSKFAQHKSNENVILYGPSSVRIDPFLRQPVSDWHILERNKGFGLVVDDVWNLDWETLWRGNVMDKYSRPYRDTKTGEWIGGYIQKRFEVDKWIPPENNYQLLPGQLRKPYIPEQRSTEARLEAMREKDADKRGYKPVSTGKPFNWHQSSFSKRKGFVR